MLIGLFMEMYLLMDPVVLSVIYVWCQLNKETIVTFWFGTKFKAIYLPWVLLGFNVLINGGGLSEIVGIIVGHMYYFAVFQYPQEHGGTALLRTPKFLETFLPPYQNTRNTAGFTYIPPSNRSTGNAAASQSTGGSRFFGGYQWGRGRRLDD